MNVPNATATPPQSSSTSFCDTTSFHKLDPRPNHIHTAMPTPSSPHARTITPTPPSAWSRLVQRTQSAASSHTASAKPVAPASTRRDEAHPSSGASMTKEPEPARSRRRTGLKRSPAAPNTPAANCTSNGTTRAQKDVVAQSRHVEDEEECCIEVCPCLEGEAPLCSGKCSLSGASERKKASISPPSNSKRKVDLLSFWAPRTKVEDVTGAQQDMAVHAGDEEVGAGEDGAAETDVVPSRVGHSKRGGVEGDTSDELAPAFSRVAKSRMARPQMPNVQPTDPASLTSRTTRNNTSPSRSAKRISHHMPRPNLVSHPNSTRRDALDETARDLQVECQDEAILIRENAAVMEVREDTNLSRLVNHADVLIHADSETEDPHTTAAPSTPTPTSTTTHALSSGTHDILNRAPLPSPLSEPSSANPPTFSASLPLSDNEATARKPKRRLNLHGSTYAPQKKRKTSNSNAAKSKKKPTVVQTTLALAIGGNAGMRECKVCDTVYNPLHPEDVKVHAKRHAGWLKRRDDERGEV